MAIDASARVAILGAGPCGLACARELDRLGHVNWELYEADAVVGGLARSVRDPAGFTWDLGGHVVFSHYGEFDALLSEVMGADVHHHDRSSYIRSGERWVPYPFQNNLRHLAPEQVRECLEGLAAAPGGRPEMTFADWLLAQFGAGLNRLFMAPYNAKVWATDAAEMQSRWQAERVAVVDYARAAASVAEGRDDLAWGPNNHFVFPALGGTGEIYRRMALPLAARIHHHRRAVGIDAAVGEIRFADGSRAPYDALVTTLPLDRLVGMVDAVPEALSAAAGALVHNSVHMTGVGYERPLEDTRSWMYFPDANVPFYRVTNFAKYGAANVPDADTGRYCSYMTETAFSATRPLARAGLEERVLAGLVTAGLAGPADPVASVHVETLDYAYPVPTLGRDAALATIQPWLEARGILSRGRFGAWRYELGNMDHAVKMGIDAARRLVADRPEEAYLS